MKYLHDEDRILKNITQNKITGCWEWCLQKDQDGYGRVKYKKKKCGAHRVSFSVFIGEIPKHLCVCHICDNPSCVNPNHLFLGTISDNNKDRKLKGRNRNQFGEHNTSSKLTKMDVKEIRIKYNTGNFTQQNLAYYYNVTQHAIWDVVHYNTWA